MTGVDVGMRSEEGKVGGGLIPSRKQLGLGVAKEATDVGAGEGHAREGEGEDHRK